MIKVLKKNQAALGKSHEDKRNTKHVVWTKKTVQLFFQCGKIKEANKEVLLTYYYYNLTKSNFSECEIILCCHCTHLCCLFSMLTENDLYDLRSAVQLACDKEQQLTEHAQLERNSLIENIKGLL